MSLLLTFEKIKIKAVRVLVMHKPLLTPSILAANYANLEADIKAAEKGGADNFHLDIMDGHFVPNMTIGPLVIEAVRRRFERSAESINAEIAAILSGQKKALGG